MDRRTELLNKPTLSADERLELTFGSAVALQRARLKSAINAADREIKSPGTAKDRRDLLARKRAVWNDELIALQTKPSDVLPLIPVYDTKPMAAE